jgi:hypothetical protein
MKDADVKRTGRQAPAKRRRAKTDAPKALETVPATADEIDPVSEYMRRNRGKLAGVPEIEP